MAFNRNHARPLCTDTEYKLFTASLADEIDELTADKAKLFDEALGRFEAKAAKDSQARRDRRS